ncbi:MAG: mitochondrial fission ELM1 family protein [Alphaproteobacteria bacterium]|nr:mitochondrial fission ELM1 family protein [Alphaproteobacteria bacterium]
MVADDAPFGPEAPSYCWVLTDGRAGNRSPARGLAEAVGLPIVEKTITLSKPWQWLPAKYWPQWLIGKSMGTDTRASDPLTPPWPALIITCGRRSIGPALAVKRRSQGRTSLVHIQNPRMDPRAFDLIAAPAHDGISGDSIVVTTGSLHGVTRAKLDEAATHWQARLSHLPSPRIAVLIGGSNSAYRLDAETGTRIAQDLAKMARDSGAGLMVTTSRRTDPDAATAIRAALANAPAVIWSGEGENPYFGYLGLADRIIVTGDSVNMVSEAAATERPVQVIQLPLSGRASKFEHFHRAMEEAGATRKFEGALVDWDFNALNDTSTVAQRVRDILRHKGVNTPSGI